MKGGNLVFSVDGVFPQQDPGIRAAWQAYSLNQSDGAVVGRCLVTGETGPIARLHPSIKGVRDAQPSGLRWFPSTRRHLNPMAMKTVIKADRD